VADEGVLPSWDYGVGVGAGVRVARVQLKAAAVLWRAQDRGSGDGTFGARYTRYTGELSGCYALPVGPLAVGPCVLLELEGVTVRGSGPQVTPKASQTVWLAAGVAARARWSIASWAALFVRPSVTFATSRPIFAIDGVSRPLYQVPAAAAAFELGCEWIL
jgi:hypothetical protein